MGVEEMLRGWLDALTILHRGHWQAARHYEGRNFWLGMMAAVAAAVAGTTAFATLESSPSLAVRIAIGGFGVLAAVLSTLQTYFRSSELAERHKSAAVKYGVLRRDLELDLTLGLQKTVVAGPGAFDEFRTRWDAVDGESPPVPSGIYQRAVRNVALARRRADASQPGSAASN